MRMVGFVIGVGAEFLQQNSDPQPQRASFPSTPLLLPPPTFGIRIGFSSVEIFATR